MKPKPNHFAKLDIVSFLERLAAGVRSANRSYDPLAEPDLVVVGRLGEFVPVGRDESL